MRRCNNLSALALCQRPLRRSGCACDVCCSGVSCVLGDSPAPPFPPPPPHLPHDFHIECDAGPAKLSDVRGTRVQLHSYRGSGRDCAQTSHAPGSISEGLRVCI